MRGAMLWLVLAAQAPATPRELYPVRDLTDARRLVILIFGDAGTGEAGQYRVGRAMYDVCRERGCQLALMLGDNIYENGIQVSASNAGSAAASAEEILSQFDAKFEAPYRAFEELDRFAFWAVLGNHDYRRNTLGTHVTYSEFSELWRMPALHYEVPGLPEWAQVYGLHTDTDVRRDLNGLQVRSARNALCDDSRPDRWKIVFGHQPVHNSGHHRGDANERRVRALLEEPLLKRCGVHLYLSGHAHHQEHLTADGYEQVVSGAAGKSKGRNKGPQAAGVVQRHFSREFGFAVLELEPATLRLRFYDVLGTREKGDLFAPRSEDVFESYKFCATRETIGAPGSAPSPC